MKLFIPVTLTLFALLTSFTSHGQDPGIRGTLLDSAGEPVAYAYICLKDTRTVATSDRNGQFSMRSRPGRYTIMASALGYKTFEKEIEVRTGERTRFDIVLENEVIEIDNVTVEAKSPVQQVRESSYNVIAIDAAALRNTTLDLAHALDRVSGVRVRESGGVGSSASISLNGFTGRHVKVFMDGIPMEGSGSSFGINNIPVSMAERIEVYKGVVPVELGADAIGGVINIVTRNTANTYLDASYSYGSFNTHRSSVSFGHVTPKGFVVQVNAYQNYSDNSYRVWAPLLYLSGEKQGAWSDEEFKFRRFHDMYRNEAVMAKIGVTDKKWASRFLVGATLSQEKDEIQNSNLTRIVFGGKTAESRSVMPNISYEKRGLFTRGLNLSLSANYSRVHSNSTDSLARQYNWAGEYVDKTSVGEGPSFSLSEFNNDSYNVTGNLRYNTAGKHFISLNTVFSSYRRKATDAAANSENSDGTAFMKRTNNRSVSGLSYLFRPADKLNLTAFGKYYTLKITGPVNTSTSTAANYELRTKKFDTYGYGAAGSYMAAKGLQVKISYEQAYRLPTERELFGDEVLETGDTGLEPEKSNNINLNFHYNGEFGGGHAVHAEAGLFHRNTQNYIRRLIEQKFGGAYYLNHGKVQTVGMDVEARYFWRDKLTVGGNLTWQNMRNLEKLQYDGNVSSIYKDRMPNVPYMFSNIDVSYNFRNLLCRGSILTIGYNLNYIHEFYRAWQSTNPNKKVPDQLSHDLSLTYSFRDSRYNISFEANNITDEDLFDNYSLQKPGRSFTVKLRYFFFKARESAKNPSPFHTGASRKHSHGRRHDDTF